MSPIMYTIIAVIVILSWGLGWGCCRAAAEGDRQLGIKQ